MPRSPLRGGEGLAASLSFTPPASEVGEKAPDCLSGRVMSQPVAHAPV